MRALIIKIDFLLSLTLILIVGWTAAYFFLGSDETYLTLKNNLVESVFRRLIGSILFGLFCQLLILLVNFIYNSTRSKATDKINMKKLFIILSACTLVGSIIGTAIFFSR